MKAKHNSDHISLSLRFVWSLSALLALSIILLEFIFDLGANFWWGQIVLIIDLVLISGFLFFLAQSVFINRFRLKLWVLEEKTNLATLFLVACFAYIPRLAAAIIIVRLIIAFVFTLLDTEVGKALSSQINLRPSQTLALSFIGLILCSSLLLTFPAATQDGKGMLFIDALFTTTSAACVTGLMVISDVNNYFSLFGQAVILATIQVGGLGIMVLSASFAVLVGGRLPTRRQVGYNEILDVRTVKGLKSLISAIAATTITMELCGAIALFLLWSNDFNSFFERAWWSLFHSVSAFCNAGIGLAPDSLSRWVDSPSINLVFILLITTGGLGFMSIADLSDPRNWKSFKLNLFWSRLHIQTKVVLTATLVLNVFGMLLFLYLEYDGALHGLSVGTKINASLFQAVTLRTAGFFVVPLGSLAIPTVLFSCVWMFIGASPGSCAGGIKTTTTAVCLMSIRTMLRGRDQVELFGRRVPAETVNRSMSVALIAVIVIILFLMFLTGTQNLPFEKLLFEALSAFGTVGLSMDMTPLLNTVGKLLIIMLMYIGRIGPLTAAMALGQRQQIKSFSYPEARLAVG